MGGFTRGSKIGPTRWVSSVHPELGWVGPLNYWPEKNRAKFGPAQYGPARYGPTLPNTFKRLFGSTSPVFRAGWAAKILARKIRANFGNARFGPAHCWPGPARPDPPDCHLWVLPSFHREVFCGYNTMKINFIMANLHACFITLATAMLKFMSFLLLWNCKNITFAIHFALLKPCFFCLRKLS